MSPTEIGLLAALTALIAAVIGVWFGEQLNVINAQVSGINARLDRIEKSLGLGVFKGEKE